MSSFRKAIETVFFNDEESEKESSTGDSLLEMRNIIRDTKKLPFDEAFSGLAKFSATELASKMIVYLQNEELKGIVKPENRDYCLIFRRNSLRLYFLESFEQLSIVRGGTLIVETSGLGVNR